MNDIQNGFSKSYAQAREKFLNAAQTAGLQVDSNIHPLPGRDGETLAMDVVLDGAPDANALLVISSACHGVEGYCGSGVQIHALKNTAWREAARARGVAVLYIHALNPHGFSHVRRVTHENVDINRNFQDFSKPLPDNPAYREIHTLLLPEVWPPDAANAQATAQYIAERGMKTYQAAVSKGQHEFPDGLFFGGQAPTWSNQTLRSVLKKYGQRCQKMAWIDLHTGLGPSGVGERIFACADDAAAFARAKAWWGQGITSIYDGSSSSPMLTGLMWMAAYQECRQAEYTGIAMEYGTQAPDKVIYALRGDHWLQGHPEAPEALKKQIKQDLMDAFYVDTDEWRSQIVEQAMAAMHQAVTGLKTP
ncbi:M14 family metallopeptidase [Limnohabitans sp. 2KL-27]|uniref:M14 family metallopeptidase n=1 Tax=Limnohabitans sp. 2KL-27 TaxID=1100705 RepID=UPI000AE4CBE9|nr:M14 family metallopeptidase [Limnohabitans sp. 2KL-27]